MSPTSNADLELDIVIEDRWKTQARSEVGRRKDTLGRKVDNNIAVPELDQYSGIQAVAVEIPPPYIHGECHSACFVAGGVCPASSGGCREIR